jgi:hypothetical protein
MLQVGTMNKNKKNWLKGEERSNIYLTHVCRLLWNVDSLEGDYVQIKYQTMDNTKNRKLLPKK